MEVLMPQLGETVAEGTISVWFKQVGDTVAAGDNLFEIETDKVAMEVQATESGVLSEIRVEAGGVVPVGAVVAVIGGEGQAGAKATADKAPAAAASSAPAAPAPETASPSSRAAANGAATSNGAARSMDPWREVATPEKNFGPATGPLGLKVTPLARRLAAQRGIDLAAVAAEVRDRGGKRIQKADVEAAKPAADARSQPQGVPQAPRPPVARIEGDQIEPLNRIRRQTAKHLAQSWSSAPHVFQAVEVDFSRVDKTRKAAKAAFKERTGVSLTYLPFIARATAIALRDFPKINALLDGDELVVRRDINLGIAVDLSHEGLVVPVIRDAGGMTVAGLATAIDRLAKKARAGKLEPGDMEGGTYSISNNGSFGTLFTAPIINGPQVAILSTDAVRKRPVVVETDDGDMIVARPMGMVAQSFDHRAMDGAYSASFLSRMKEILETRDWAADLE